MPPRKGFDVIRSLVVWALAPHIHIIRIAIDGVRMKQSLDEGHVDDQTNPKHASLFAGI